jgi:hypothetical protein
MQSVHGPGVKSCTVCVEKCLHTVVGCQTKLNQKVKVLAWYMYWQPCISNYYHRHVIPGKESVPTTRHKRAIVQQDFIRIVESTMNDMDMPIPSSSSSGG